MESRLNKNLEDIHEQVIQHPVYAAVIDRKTLAIFMEAHVFAVWDFMCLLKSLQRRLTCVDVPWFPSEDPVAARLINEIVLIEETDELAPGHIASHFDLYLRAMTEVGANTKNISAFLHGLKQKVSIEELYRDLKFKESVKNFIDLTLSFTTKPIHVTASAFFYGRERIIPLMFKRVLESDGIRDCPSFRLYLERHINVDDVSHGPMASKILERLCGKDLSKWTEAEKAAEQALLARRKLWDNMYADIGGSISSFSSCDVP